MGRIGPFLLIRFVFGLAAALLCENASNASLMPYIKTAGPGTYATPSWVFSHYDMTDVSYTVDAATIAAAKASNPDLFVEVYDGITFAQVHNTTTVLNKYDVLLAYCRTSNLNDEWESVFLHYAANVNVNWTSGTNRPRENRYNSVITYENSTYTDRTGTAYGDDYAASYPATYAIPFDAASGNIVYIGYRERFKEVNFNLSTGASGGWTGIWEYWTGTAWQSVSPSSDGTNSSGQAMAQSGKVEFVPPPTTSQWKTATAATLSVGPGTTPLFWLRLRCTASGTSGPTWQSVQTQHGNPWQGTSGVSGQKFITDNASTETFPGWDPANDANGDGVWDTNSNPNATATFKYQSRAPIWAYYPEQWTLYPGSSFLNSWQPGYEVNLVNQENGGVDALFLDVVNTAPITDMLNGAGTYLEYPDKTVWKTDLEASLAAVVTALHAVGKKVICNTWQSGGEPWYDPQIIVESDGILREFFTYIGVAETLGTTFWLDKYGGGQPKTWDAAGKLIRYNYQDTSSYGDRDKILGLARYLLMSYSHTYFDYGMPISNPPAKWIAAIEWVGSYLGAPNGDAYVCQTFTDPSNSRTAYVFGRNFTYSGLDRLLLDRPVSWDGATLGDTSAVTFPLPHAYRPLNADGTLGSPTTSVTLRNGEGAMLVETADLLSSSSLTLAVDKANAKPGETVAYSITYGNFTTQAITNAVITDQLPATVTYVPGSATLNGVSISPDPVTGGVLTLAIGQVQPGEQGTIRLEVVVR